jgi:hypothetical protein
MAIGLSRRLDQEGSCMNLMDLAQASSQLKVEGLFQAVLKMPSPKFRGKLPAKVKTPFGLCSWYPTGDNSHILIFVTAEQIEKHLKKALKDMETKPNG